jgi:hypothetical protein
MLINNYFLVYILEINSCFNFNNLILNFDKYKLIDWFYDMLVYVYPFYKFIKSILIKTEFYFIKFYIILINDNILFHFNKFMLKNFLYMKYDIIYLATYINRRFLKLRKKYRTYYKFTSLGYLKIFLFIFLFSIFMVMWRNRTTYHTKNLFLYIFFINWFILLACYIFLPFFTYKFIGLFFLLFITFLILYLKVLN